MKKLILSINPEMYNRYKGLHAYFDALAISIATCNFISSKEDVFAVSDSIGISSTIIEIKKENDCDYNIVHKFHKVILGTITRVNL